MISKIKSTLPFVSKNHTTRFIIHRNRGNHYPLDIVWGSRYKPSDSPEYYRLETGERLPSLPYDYVTNDADGNPTVKLLEADDSQYVAFKTDVSKDIESDDLDGVDWLDMDTDYEDEAAKIAKSEDLNFNPVKFSVLDDRDERKTFLADELKTKNSKYEGNSIANWVKDNPEIVMVVGTAVALAILYTQMGGAIMSFIEYSKSGQLAADMAANAATSGGGGGGAPPG